MKKSQKKATEKAKYYGARKTISQSLFSIRNIAVST